MYWSDYWMHGNPLPIETKISRVRDNSYVLDGGDTLCEYNQSIENEGGEINNNVRG
jgi:hypothetical protein